MLGKKNGGESEGKIPGASTDKGVRSMSCSLSPETKRKNIIHKIVQHITSKRLIDSSCLHSY
jgi:hypothetical protein